MKKNFFLLVAAAALVITSCGDKTSTSSTNAVDSSDNPTVSTSETSGMATDTSITLPPNPIDPGVAKEMVKAFREEKVKIKRESDENKGDKSTLWAELKLSELKQLVNDGKVTGIQVMTAAKDATNPTMILRVIWNKGLSGEKQADTTYYHVQSAQLCPDPPDCGPPVVSSK